MSNVTVGHFLISDSIVERLDHEAFDINVVDTFAIERTHIDYIDGLAFYNIRATPSASSIGTAKMSLVNLSASHFEDNALKIQDHFKNGGGTNTNITYEAPCNCDMYKISGNNESHNHKPMNHTPSLDIDFTLSSDTMLNFVYCKDGGGYIPWFSFDTDECAEDHDHVIEIPTFPGLGKNMTLALIIGGGAVFVIGLYRNGLNSFS